MTKPRSRYMHTIEGQPGQFRFGMISFAGRGPIRLADSLKQIRAEQKASMEYREQRAWRSHRYGYVRVNCT